MFFHRLRTRAYNGTAQLLSHLFGFVKGFGTYQDFFKFSPQMTNADNEQTINIGHMLFTNYQK
jgi:hypothetical protein